ncbi:50S ribosomal protein L21 [Candidatus Cerribacteria bacterium 'Amazon FNV 2010 28 9']|uniref:Large ribosomal subunit protein bL21 n=1 Tax=Candidatus Cerribacteria bacterium 'Amazon FNV 2010 28 9' TaxID=2081795 RepID=A0A317JRS6_9BACT|nr:MAG: 50S ribosomal protein L21 [Candidatus Cerribacteria bacterium 'Amazon FNV 2010 28 9']
MAFGVCCSLVDLVYYIPMKYAVIQLSGKQHVVREGEKLQVDRLEGGEQEALTIKDVLLIADGETVSIGAPFVEKAVVKAKIVSHEKGEKIRVATFKAKSRQRKVRGHRQHLTTIEIEKISA